MLFGIITLFLISHSEAAFSAKLPGISKYLTKAAGEMRSTDPHQAKRIFGEMKSAAVSIYPSLGAFERENATLSSYVASHLIGDLKSMDLLRVQNALKAIPDYMNNAFYSFHGCYRGDEIEKLLVSIYKNPMFYSAKTDTAYLLTKLFGRSLF